MKRSLLLLALLLSPSAARRGALVRDGMSSKGSYDNPHESGNINTDPDVVAITTRCSKWSVDPVDCLGLPAATAETVGELFSREMRGMPLHVTFRSARLGGKRPNWMRATATLGDPSLKSKARPHVPVRAVWTCSNVDAEGVGVGANSLEDSYEDCVKRLYGKFVELEVLLPRTKAAAKNLVRGSPPPSIVYRVPIQGGHVNPLGVVSKSRATVTLYPRGRTLAAANARAGGGRSRGGEKVVEDEKVELGTTSVHLPRGPGLVDPGWAKGRRTFWTGRSVGVV